MNGSKPNVFQIHIKAKLSNICDLWENIIAFRFVDYRRADLNTCNGNDNTWNAMNHSFNFFFQKSNVLMMK